MRRWRIAAGERRSLYSAVGLRLIDLLTGGLPVGWVQASLDLLGGAGWQPAPGKLLLSTSGILTAPHLERTAHPGAVPRRYRIRLTAEFYRPLYQVTLDGVEFDAFPYNDNVAPASFARTTTETLLVPSPAYPFPPHVPVLRGAVVDPAAAPVEDAVLTDPGTERAVTDARGAFALPLRTAAPGAPITITATHPRSARTGSIQVTLPADVGRSQTIQVS
jgi:hypothetical protein